MDKDGFLKVDKIYFCKFLSNKEMWYINLYVLCKTNSIMWSKLFMDIIIGVKKFLHGSGRGPEGWPDLLLSNVKLQRSAIYQFVCTFWYKSNCVIKITYVQHSRNQEDPLWMRKGSWKRTSSTSVNCWATKNFNISICMYFVR